MLPHGKIGGQRAAPQVRRRRGFRRAVETAQALGGIVGDVLLQQPRIGLLDTLHRLPGAIVHAVLDQRIGLTHEHVGVYAPGRIRALAQHLRRMQGDLVIVRRTRHVIAQAVVATGLDRQHRIAVRGAIAHGRIGDAAAVLHARPERPAGRAHVVLVQRLAALPTFGGTVVVMLLGVAVAAEHQHVRELLEQREQARAIRMAERLTARRSIEQRDVHAEHDQAITRQALEVIAEEGELVRAQAADVARLGLGVVDHIIEEHETRAPLFHRIGIRAVHGAPAVQRVRIVAGVHVQVMVARHVEPRHLQLRGDLVDVRVQAQVVIDDVAQGGAQPRRVLADDRLDDGALVVADVLAAGGLRIGEHQHLETVACRIGALGRFQREIPVAGGAAGGADAVVLQLRRPLRRVVAPVGRQPIGRRREAVLVRLDHEDGLALAHRQAVAAIGGGAHDRFAVGDLHTGQAGIGRAAPWLAVALLIHLAGDGRFSSPGRRSHQQQASQPGGSTGHRGRSGRGWGIVEPHIIACTAFHRR
ncbi:hypothetical protein D3C71_1103800 [compost metagenome]